MIETSTESSIDSPLQAWLEMTYHLIRMIKDLKELDSQFGSNHDNVQQATLEE